MPFIIHSLLMRVNQVSCRLCVKFPPSDQKSLVINRLLVIKPLGLKPPAPIVNCYDMKEGPDVSSAPALRGFDE